ncbi:hypothetical protein G6F46_000279 [Rhizopus delemar]|nr:hypothetical protein G6F54_000532 [Rhizopus delemar]KAG1518703.1 hypothetical protein G6F53_000374 [Rhizopus delemar]KAG1562223.1 hypothetical protein G6F49_001100 [Rhizopus delemar]KAG1595056.1 hypothetical protein G6F48_000945 [Rhizopus delemar]KAG1604309.1 hypothetical protein G6F47_001042 [Rhizopus delemar]
MAENMKYAIMLTLCELSSAKIKAPNDCTTTLDHHDQLTRCIQKLSASPQAWTSYSGYFRDIVLICFAIKYPMEKEILEKLHENITLNQVKNFDILQSQQNYLIQWRQQEFDMLDVLKESQVDVINHIAKAKDYYQKTESQIEFLFDTLGLLQNKTQLAIIQYDEMVNRHIEQVYRQLNDLLIHQTMEIDGLVDALLLKLDKVHRHVEQSLLDQIQATNSWNEYVKNIELELNDRWKNSIQNMSTILYNAINGPLDEIKQLQDKLNVAHHHLIEIMKPFHWVSENTWIIYSQGLSAVKHLIMQLLAWATLCNRLQTLFQVINVQHSKACACTLASIIFISSRQFTLNIHLNILIVTSACLLTQGILMCYNPEAEENMYNSIQQVPSTCYDVPSTFTVKDTYHFHRYYSYSS